MLGNFSFGKIHPAVQDPHRASELPAADVWKKHLCCKAIPVPTCHGVNISAWRFYQDERETLDCLLFGDMLLHHPLTNLLGV